MKPPTWPPIGERARRIVEAFEKRQKGTGGPLTELTELLSEEAKQAEQERRDSDLSLEAFSVGWLLKNEQIADAEQIAHELEPAFAENPHWRQSADQERGIRIALHKPLLPRIGIENSAEVVDRILDVLKRSRS